MKKLQVALDEYISAHKAFEPFHKQIETVKNRVLDIFVRNHGLINENAQNREFEFLEQVLSDRRLQMEDNVRASLTDAYKFWMGIKDQVTQASTEFKLAEAKLLAELEPLVKAHTDQLIQKQSDTLAQSIKAVLPFCDGEYEAERLVSKCSANINADCARSNWRAITNPASQAKWLLRYSNQ